MSQRDRPANLQNPTAFIGMLVCLAPLGGCLEQTNDLLDIEPLPALSEGADGNRWVTAPSCSMNV